MTTTVLWLQAVAVSSGPVRPIMQCGWLISMVDIESFVEQSLHPSRSLLIPFEARIIKSGTLRSRSHIIIKAGILRSHSHIYVILLYNNLCWYPSKPLTYNN